MIVTIPPGIAIHHFRFHHACPDHVLRYLGIIRSLLFGSLAVQTDGLMIEHGQYTLILGGQLNVASVTGQCTGQITFPLIFH
jgi:hypothetical protein